MKEVPKTIKDALYSTIHRHETLDVDAIAEQLNMASSYLYRAALPDPDTDGPNASGVRFPLKQLVPLLKITGDFQVLDYIENSVGRVAIPIPGASGSIKDIQTGAIKAAAEFGDLMTEVANSCIDGKLTANEKRRIVAEGWEAITAIAKLVKNCENM